MARSLVKRIGEKLGEEDWRDTWRGGLARHLAKRIGEEEEKQTAVIKSSNPHLAGGEIGNPNGSLVVVNLR